MSFAIHVYVSVNANYAAECNRNANNLCRPLYVCMYFRTIQDYSGLHFVRPRRSTFSVTASVGALFWKGCAAKTASIQSSGRRNTTELLYVAAYANHEVTGAEQLQRPGPSFGEVQ